MNSSTYRIRTGSGVVHALTVGRTYVKRGDVITNSADSVIGKADCGSTTSSAARLTDEPVTCAKCIAAAQLAADVDELDAKSHDVATVRRLHGADTADYIAERHPLALPLIADGWTIDGALNHIQGVCDVAICCGFGEPGFVERGAELDGQQLVEQPNGDVLAQPTRDVCDRDVCAGGHAACVELDADHVDEDGVKLHCPFCRRATHYAERVGDYRHCDRSTCWQTSGDAETMARATGAVAATVTVERRALDGSLTVESVDSFTRDTAALLRGERPVDDVALPVVDPRRAKLAELGWDDAQIDAAIAAAEQVTR